LTISLENMAEELKKYREYCIVYHIRPDGDCIGSSYALGLALKQSGARCRVEGTDEIPLSHRYMTDKVSWDETSDPVYISVDSSSCERTGSYKDFHFTFCIDHHRNNSVDSDYKYVEEDCGACSEIIFKLLKAMNADITPQIADFLYLGLIMDTMCFRTTDTSPQSFAVASELAACGADIYGIGRRHMYIKSSGRVKIEKMLQDSLNFTSDGRIITGIITQDNLREAGIHDSELEGINSFVEQIEGIRVGVTVRELADGKSRCSVRSSGDIPADRICEVHGGGGHFHAACCVLDCSPEEARGIMEKTACEFL